MKRFTGLILACALLTAWVGLGCEPMEPPGADVSQIASQLSTIPAEYGELEAVTTVAEYPGWFQLWFEDESGTIRVVRVQLFENLMHNQVKTIERSGAVAEEVSEDEG